VTVALSPAGNQCGSRHGAEAVPAAAAHAYPRPVIHDAHPGGACDEDTLVDHDACGARLVRWVDGGRRRAGEEERAQAGVARKILARRGRDPRRDRVVHHDPDLHELRALALVALGRYTEAAAVLYSVLSVKPGWNWATLIGLYPDVDTFTTQIRTLEHYCAEHPSEAPPRFVLAHLHVTMGSTNAAADQLRAVIKLQPDD
jgi:hypothetical protein